MKKTNQTGAAQLLERISLPSASAPKYFQQNSSNNNEVASKSILFDVRAPVRLFTGREQEVSDLHERILKTNNQNTIVIAQIASVTGLGGIGKTELCRNYIQKHRKDYDGNVIWINAEKEDLITESFKRLAKDVLGISTKDINGEDKSMKTTVADVYEYFQGKKCLFVFEYAESGDHLTTYLPKLVDGGPFILITSRDRDWKFSVTVFELDVLSEQDAIRFVKSGLNIIDNSQNEDILTLVNSLQNFPLALQQAISFISQRRQVDCKYDIPKYLKAYALNTEKVLNSKIPTSELNDYTKTTFTAWKMTTISIALDPEHGQLAIKFLNLMSYFAADNIPVNFWYTLLDDGDEDAAMCALLLLVRYSMINIETVLQQINIHRLVQDVTRIELQRKGEEVRVIKEALTCLQANFTANLINHAISVFDYGCKYADIILEFSYFPYLIVEEMHKNQRPKEAILFGVRSMGSLLKHHATNHINILRLKIRMAEVDLALCNYSACLQVFEKTLRIWKRKYPKYVEEKLNIERAIGRTLSQLGEHQRALKFLEQVYETKKSLFGHSDRYDLESIAGIYYRMHRYEKALDYYKQALEICKSSDEKQRDKHILGISLNIALVYYQLDMQDPSSKLFVEIFDQIKTQNDDDIDIVGMKQKFVELVFNAGEYKKAKIIANVVHKKQESFFGCDGIVTLETLALIGRLKICEGEHQEGMSILKSVLEKFGNQLGERHILTLGVQYSISHGLWTSEMNEKALQLVKELIPKQFEALGPCHFDTLNTQKLQAKILESMEKFEESLECLQKLKSKLVKVCGTDHRRVSEVKNLIRRVKNKISENK